MGKKQAQVNTDIAGKLADLIVSTQPKSQDTAVRNLHLMYLAKYAEGYFKKQFDIAWQELLDSNPVMATQLQEQRELVIHNNEGNKTCYMQTAEYNLDVELRTPARGIKRDKLIVALGKRGYDLPAALAIIEEASETNNPAQVIRSVPNG